MPYKHLDDATLGAIYQASIETGLPGSRGALLSGIDPSFVATLRVDPRPANQLLLDLNELNAVPILDDGTVPLKTWLSTAVQITGPRRQSSVFREALARVTAAVGEGLIAAGKVLVAGNVPVKPNPPASWNGKLSGAEYEALTEALVAAFPTPASLRKMVRFKLEKNLAELAAEGDLSMMALALIDRAVAEDWIRRLVAGALAGNPGNPELLAFASAHGVERQA